VTAAMRECRYCAQTHGTLLLCEPARRVLDALYARGQRFDLPTIEFPEAITAADAFGEDTVICAQLVAKAAVTEVAGVPRPVLILTGRDIAERVLPSWLLPGDDEDMRRFAKLVSEMTEMAIRRARKAGPA
jgi:hypothetical protein